MTRRIFNSLNMIYLFIAIVLIIGASILIYRNGVNVNVNQTSSDLNNAKYGALFPAPDGENFFWSHNSIYPFTINSNSDIVTIQIEQDDNFLHIVDAHSNSQCPDDETEYNTSYNYYAYQTVYIISCRERSATKPNTIATSTINILVKNHTDILARYNNIAVSPQLANRYAATPVPLMPTYNTIDDVLLYDTTVPNNITAAWLDEQMILQWDKVALAMHYEIQRRRCVDECSEWNIIGRAFNTNQNKAVFIDNDKLITSLPINIFQYQIRSIFADGASLWSDAIVSVKNIHVEANSVLPTHGQSWAEITWRYHDEEDEIDVDNYTILLYRKNINNDFELINVLTDTLMIGGFNTTIIDLNIADGVSEYCYAIQIKNNTNYGILWPNEKCVEFENPDYSYVMASILSGDIAETVSNAQTNITSNTVSTETTQGTTITTSSGSNTTTSTATTTYREVSDFDDQWFNNRYTGSPTPTPRPAPEPDN